MENLNLELDTMIIIIIAISLCLVVVINRYIVFLKSEKMIYKLNPFSNNTCVDKNLYVKYCIFNISFYLSLFVTVLLLAVNGNLSLFTKWLVIFAVVYVVSRVIFVFKNL